ncbi:MAG: hypothetical protein M3Q10_10610 [Chloroflexota bacterium]|nr:hypothetical protein [Chloroflexota bacterium]
MHKAFTPPDLRVSIPREAREAIHSLVRALFPLDLADVPRRIDHDAPIPARRQRHLGDRGVPMGSRGGLPCLRRRHHRVDRKLVGIGRLERDERLLLLPVAGREDGGLGGRVCRTHLPVFAHKLRQLVNLTSCLNFPPYRADRHMVDSQRTGDLTVALLRRVLQLLGDQFPPLRLAKVSTQ